MNDLLRRPVVGVITGDTKLGDRDFIIFEAELPSIESVPRQQKLDRLARLYKRHIWLIVTLKRNDYGFSSVSDRFPP